jgi:phosphoglycerol transferase MdoB-like AlkP superfamily enzyme
MKLSVVSASLKQQFLRGRYYPVLWLSGVYLAISSLTRLALFAVNLSQLETPLRSLTGIMTVGFLYDVVTCLYLFALFTLYLFLLPQRIYQSKLHRLLIKIAVFAVMFGLAYLGVVEYFFFDEFDARFNTVAVDYLIYPHEVFVNIWQSYPVGQALVVVFIVSAILFWKLRRRLQTSLTSTSSLRTRAAAIAVPLLLLLFAYVTVDVTTGRYSQNRVVNELAQNGVYSFFYAAFNSGLDYDQYYLTIDHRDAVQRLRKLVAQPNATFIAQAANPIARHIDNGPGPAHKLNVVLLVQESLGADYVGVYGDKRGLTPNIDRLAKDSLMFTDVYATGTRTVRGLEAISASFPPLPGEAIVKRPKNEGIFNWGEVMHANGYSPTFIYGGFGTFDNMNYYFGHNGFRVVDRTDIQAPQFANIWGVSDDDLLHQAVKVFDDQYARGEKIFSLIMSTSNHKPFTYPAGIPGITPTGGGRKMGVKYADYALGKFFEEIKSRPYFDDTVFVIVGDHGARVYGKEDIPMRSYELPLLIYAPKHFKPRQIETLASQIDIAPTVLGLLHMSYDSVFFGRDVLLGDNAQSFALLSHNRDVAFYQGDGLHELGIKKASATYAYDKITNLQTRLANDDEQIKNAVSIYQEAFNLYEHGLYKIQQSNATARTKASN